jgi:tape measure domain-containing protein
MAEKPVGSFYVQLGLNTKEFRKNLRTSRRELKQAFGPEAMAASKGLALAMTGLAVAMTGVAAASVKLVANMERQEVALTRIMGSAEGAKQRLKELQEFAAVTPYTFTELVEYEKRLRALGFAANEVQPTLVTLGDAASGLGLQADGMNRLIKAFGDIRAKGYLQTQEIRQLAEAGIPAFEILAEKIGVTIPEAMKLIESRSIDAGMAITSLTEGINERFGGMMELQAETMLGMWSTVRDEGENTMRIFGGMITKSAGLKSLMESLRDAAQKFRRTLEDKGFAEAFSGIFGEKAKVAIVATAGAITGMLIPAIKSLAIATAASVGPLLKLGAAYGAIAAGSYLVIQKIQSVLNKEDPLKSLSVDELEQKMAKQREAYIKAASELDKLKSPANSFARSSSETITTQIMAAEAQAQGELARLKQIGEALAAAKERQQQDFEEIKKAFSGAAELDIVKPFTSFFKNLSKKDPVKVKVSAVPEIDTSALIKEAESTSRSIKEAWINQTQDRLAQLEYQYQKEREVLDKSKEFNKNYRRDLFMLDETYYQKRVELQEESERKEAEAIVRQTEQRARDFEDQIRMEQELANAKYERIQAEVDGSAAEMQLREYSRQGDLESYIGHLNEEKSAYRAYLDGKRNLMEAYSQFQRDAHRTNADYAAEGYRSVYYGLTDALTQVVTGTKSAGEAFKQLGLQIVQMFVKWQVQKRLSAVMARSIEATQVASSTAMAATTAAAWAPAAAMVAAATFGASTASAAAGLAGLSAMSKALTIPGLADGGIVTKPTLAMIGEGGESEAVIPLSKLNQVGGSGDLTINVNNQSGVPVNARADQRMDGGRMVIDLWLEGYERNVSGIQTIVGARS